MNLTIKQIEIMKVVVAGATAGAVVDIDQLLERLPYKTTKASLQFSLRAVERHGLIDRSFAEHRRERLRRLIAPTELGRAVIGGTGRPAPGPGAAVIDPDAASSDRIAKTLSRKPSPEVMAFYDGLAEKVSEELPAPPLSDSADLIPELDLEPQSLSLPELTFSEPQVFFEEEIVD
jgi:hypothetical protein